MVLRGYSIVYFNESDSPDKQLGKGNYSAITMVINTEDLTFAL
jgi:hypothetical protein